MKTFALPLIFLALHAPLVAAHAAPVLYQPEASAILQSSPTDIRIRFVPRLAAFIDLPRRQFIATISHFFRHEFQVFSAVLYFRF